MAASRGAALVLLALLAAAPARADDEGDKLRAMLRQATVQLRQLEDQNATLQAKQAQDAREKLDLTQKLAAAAQQIDTLQGQVKTDEELRPKLAAATSAAEAERGNNAKLQVAYQELGTAAKARDAEATQLDTTLADTRKHLIDCQDKNGELYQLGIQALDLSEKRGFFTSERATGLMRVQLENQLQDMDDKMQDNKIILPRP